MERKEEWRQGDSEGGCDGGMREGTERTRGDNSQL